MLGTGLNLIRSAYSRGLAYVRDGLKLYMPYRGSSHDEVQFVGTGSTSFDGIDDYVNCGDDTSLDVDSNITLSAWCKADTLINSAGIMVRDGYYFRKENTGKFRCYFFGPDAQIDSTTDVVAGIWYHVAVTYDGASAKMYVDGVLESTVSMSGDITDGGNFRIGTWSTVEWDGNIKNVAIWERTLTATEVQNVMYKQYNEIPTSSRLTDGLVSWWALESDYLDSTDNDNDGTASGDPTQNADVYGGDTPVIPRAIDNAPTVQADAIGSGSALFDGVDDYISIADSDNLSFGDGSTDSAFSISAWVKMTDATDFTIAHKGEFSNDIEWRFSTYNDDDIKLICGDDSAGTTYIGREYDTALTSYEGSWIHLAGTYSGNGRSDGIKIYLNGVQVDDADYESGSYTAMENQGEPVQIGRYNTVYSDGNICQVGIWDAVLDQAQIQSIMEKTYEELTASEKTNLVSYWALDETIESSGSGASFVYDKVDATLGSEMIPNGDFDTSANWVFDDAYAHNATTKKAEYDDSMSGKLIMYDAQMLSSIVSGKVYRLSFTVSDGTMSTAWYNTSISNVYIASALYTAGTHILYFIAPVSDGGLLPYTYTSGTTFSIDDISLKEVNGSAGQLI